MLNLHSGGELIELDALRQLRTPEPTATHHPLAHFEFVDMVRFALSYYGHEIVEEHHALDKDGARYFGLLSLRSTYGDYTDTLGLRNSHDKTFPIGVAFGSRVFVCSNLAFHSDVVVKRKHTQRARRELPAIISDIVSPLKDMRLTQARQFDCYRAAPLTQKDVDHLVLEFYRKGVIGIQRVDDVLEAYHKPPHDWGDETAWRLFNATTFALAGRVAENPQSTRQLHAILDAEFSVVH